MDIDIRERLEEEMTKCNSLRLYKNRVKKINNIFPDDVVENILSFTSCGCKKCVRTRKVIKNETSDIKLIYDKWAGFNIEEKMFSEEYDKYLEDGVNIWLYYFVKLNRFPTMKTLKQYEERYDKEGYNIVKCLYECLACCYSNYFLKRRCSVIKDFKDIVVWMLCIRGCQFYPQLFNEEFQRGVISYIDK